MKGQSDAKTPKEYIAKLDEPRQTEIKRVDKLIRQTVPQLKPFIMAGMLGYGPFHFKYPSGREGDWFRIGLASNKSYISLYACAADERGYVAERYKKKLPKANIGKSCVRFKKLDDLDIEALKALLRETAQTGFGM
jgi:hypothetical protein